MEKIISFKPYSAERIILMQTLSPLAHSDVKMIGMRGGNYLHSGHSLAKSN